MSESNKRSILVWDAPVRVFHWLMVASFIGAFITAESERWRLLHVTLGYTMAGLVVFRIAWGLIGTRHARFASFVRGPRAVVAYLVSILRGRPEHHTGHNPAGAVAIVALLVLTCVTAAAGWATYYEVGGKWMEALHEGAANAMLAVVVVHVLGVLLGSRLHRENLVLAMVTGRKPGSTQEGIRSTRGAVAGLVLIAVLAFWVTQWQSTPMVTKAGDHAPRTAKHAVQHHDD